MNTKLYYDSAKGKWVATLDGKVIRRSQNKATCERKLREVTNGKVNFEAMAAEAEKRDQKFGINTRFEFVEKLVNMVCADIQPSAVITGEGGLGKTYTVTKTLENNGFQDVTDLADFQAGTTLKRKTFISVKGYSTPKGLYRTLFENNKSIVVFDDCDSILKDPTATNLLKGALDSYGKRVISWNAETLGDDLPRSFNFEGRVIFISNMSQDSIDQAIRSRSMLIDLEMTAGQKIQRMEHIAESEDFLPEYSRDVVQDALKLIKELKDKAREISLRTLISVAKVRAANPKDYKDMAEYLIC